MKRKLERFRIIETRENVIEPSKPIYNAVKGKWNELVFKNENPITVELACGRGEYTVGLAARFPDKNFVGVDIKGERIWKGSTLALEQGLLNAAFLRTQIQLLEAFFAPGEIADLWLIHPDPRPRKRDVKRRLTNPTFLSMYRRLLRPGGYIRLKTDNTGLFEYTLETLSTMTGIEDLAYTDDLYNSPLRPECFDIRTNYEEKFALQGERIKYIRWQMVNAVPMSADEGAQTSSSSSTRAMLS
ncbi:MAG TPA: tRNA (guanosine(46)-N7)-methyltransferase TrmB [Cyclobacteriaceae bacterium]|jgi:tRNA (guanine-N7-)-methyltransferase